MKLFKYLYWLMIMVSAGVVTHLFAKTETSYLETIALFVMLIMTGDLATRVPKNETTR